MQILYRNVCRWDKGKTQQGLSTCGERMLRCGAGVVVDGRLPLSRKGGNSILFIRTAPARVGASAALLAKHFPTLKCIINQTDFSVASTDSDFLAMDLCGCRLDLWMDYFSHGIFLFLAEFLFWQDMMEFLLSECRCTDFENLTKLI